ncbi:hypothetical protein QPL51_03760 [Escherichia coli]|uniref:hypothetical protein n=1 Tax=Escherichia coli TaxID=562 RepID=UPI002879A25E|nr:hypothetical protein [Escherichia coli]MDS1552154.1 hypothetical protein [Escherichia coli]
MTNDMEMMMSEHSAVLKKILKDLDGEFNVTEEEYQNWKKGFEQLTEYDKVFNMIGVISQYLLGGGRASASILASAIICTSRWCDEKSLEDF